MYAFITPAIHDIFLGEIPVPVQAPPAVPFDDVTNGYVPKSTSSIVPCAPSSITFLPSDINLFIRYDVSVTYFFKSSIWRLQYAFASSIFIGSILYALTAYLFNSSMFVLIFSSNIFSLNKSPILIPFLAVLSIYVGPIPLPVVPILLAPFNSSLCLSKKI